MFYAQNHSPDKHSISAFIGQNSVLSKIQHMFNVTLLYDYNHTDKQHINKNKFAIIRKNTWMKLVMTIIR